MAVEYLLKYEYPNVQLLCFNSPHHALNEVNHLNPDILFLDLNMPEINGWAFLEQIQDSGVKFPIYILSSSIDIADIKKASKYNLVSDFISKPLTKDHLNKVLNLKAS